MKKKLLFAIFLLFLLSTYSSRNHFDFGSIFNIKHIEVENNNILKESEIKKDFSFLYKKNLFFLKIHEVKKELDELSFIESFEIKKIYPNKIKIKIFEKKPIAIIQNKREKYFITTKGDLITYFNYKNFANLPIVFGDENSFMVLYKNLKKLNFPIKKIKSFYLFETKRWDLTTERNQLIKLPIKNYQESLKNFINIKDQSNFEKFKIFDYRIKGQLILK